MLKILIVTKVKRIFLVTKEHMKKDSRSAQKTLKCADLQAKVLCYKECLTTFAIGIFFTNY